MVAAAGFNHLFTMILFMYSVGVDDIKRYCLTE